MTNFQKLIGISALIFSLTIAYYLIIYLPNKDQRQESSQSVEEPCTPDTCPNPFR